MLWSYVIRERTTPPRIPVSFDSRYSGLLLALENGAKVPFNARVTETCNAFATTSLESNLVNINEAVEPFVTGSQSVDFNLLSPFVIFIVDKAATIVTERLIVGVNPSEGLKQPRNLRTFLTIVEARWLGCGKFSHKEVEEAGWY